MRVLSPDPDSGSPPAPQVGFAALAKASSADPKTQSEAYASDEEGWRASEKKEVANHESNGSWVLVERSSVPRNRNLIKLIWVYKVKRDGSLKSRLRLYACKVAAKYPASTTTKLGAAPCAVPRSASSPPSRPLPTCECAAGTSSPPTSKES